MDSFLMPIRGSEAEDHEANWKKLGNCHDMNPEIFFPDRGASTKPIKEICNGCAIKSRCLEEALYGDPDTGGIAGGTTRGERVKIRRARKLASDGNRMRFI